MNYVYCAAAFVLCFAATVLILKKLIPILKSKKMGQKILDIGPRWHMSKEGTPTMGGLSFIISSVLVFTVYALIFRPGLKMIFTVVFALLNGMIGIIDDRTKFTKNKNEGLLAWQKYLLQLTVAGAYIAALRIFCGVGTTVNVPFSDVGVELGIAWYPIMLLIITGIINSVNLADGIDGLAAGETSAVALFFIASAAVLGNNDCLAVSSVLLGATAGFLVYNFHPARVFMGDTGSLYLGAMVVGISISFDQPVWALIVGFMYVLEAISDILQVLYFKATHGKRLFKMAPIHHHFEKCGWSEIKIFTVFTLITFLLGAITFIFDVAI